MKVFKQWLNKLLDFLHFYRGPVLKSSYDVSDREIRLATLTNPDPDQFWVAFSLTVLTQDSAKLETLYSWNFWNSDSIVFTEIDSGQRVHFIPMLQWEETETEAFIIDYFKDYPKRVNLRGP